MNKLLIALTAGLLVSGSVFAQASAPAPMAPATAAPAATTPAAPAAKVKKTHKKKHHHHHNTTKAVAPSGPNATKQ